MLTGLLVVVISQCALIPKGWKDGVDKAIEKEVGVKLVQKE